MEVATIYAGQGDTAVIKHDGEAIVVDTYWEEDSRETREKEVEEFIGETGVQGIIVTGYDSDHGDPRGVEYYAERFHPSWIAAPRCYNEEYREKREELQVLAKEHNLEWIDIGLETDGSDASKLEKKLVEFEVEVFSPHAEDANNSNNGSIVAKIIGRGHEGWSYLVTGDTENDRWETINRIFGKRLSCNSVSIPHHGAENGSNEKTAALCNAEQAQASAGVDNQFDHPRKESIEIWEKHGEVRATNEGKKGKSLCTFRHGSGGIRTITLEEYMETELVRTGHIGAGVSATGGVSGARTAYGTSGG